ncbi:MAG: hypothetical protein ACXVB9_12815 [Bdellovibrionota bacterium]
MRTLHLSLGCLFAPLIIYFCLSGAWQVFGLNDVPKEAPTQTRVLLHAISNPHTHSTAPGRNPKTAESLLFSVAAALAAVGMIVTSLIGIALALQLNRKRRIVLACLALGILVPAALLYI